MTKAQHTPGPWVTDGGSHVQAIYTPNDGGKPFYHTIARTDQPLVTPEQAGANALLIAAAPLLLKALKRWAEFAENNRWTDEDHHTGEIGWITETKDAINAAEGREDALKPFDADAQQAFDHAISGGVLSGIVSAHNYAGKYMYMGTQTNSGGKRCHAFKHIHTREYIFNPLAD